jgi:DNA-binding IclR family transcriptional regulator
VLLAALGDDEVIARLPAKLEKKAPGTIDDRDALLKELRRIRMRGYAIYRGGWRSDVTGVAVPIHDPEGKAVAGVCVPAPSYRVTRAWLDRIVPALRATAERIEQDLAAASTVPFIQETLLRSAVGHGR